MYRQFWMTCVPYVMLHRLQRRHEHEQQRKNGKRHCSGLI